jgi:hypothetical protein
MVGWDTRFTLLLLLVGLPFGWPLRRPKAVPPMASERETSLPAPSPTGLLLAERALALTLALLLLIEVPLALVTTHAFVGRYALYTSMGVALLAIDLIYQLSRGNRGVMLAVLGLLTVVWVGIKVRFQSTNMVHANPYKALLARAPAKPKPILLEGGQSFLELYYHAEPELQRRLYRPSAREQEIKYIHSDTGERLMGALKHRVPINAPTYDQFLAEFPDFLLTAHEADATATWPLKDLAERGYTLRLLQQDGQVRLWEAQAPAH